MSVQLPVWDTINAAWTRVSGSKGSFWAAAGIIFVIMFGIGVLEGITENLMFVSGLLGIIGSVLGYFLQLGLIYMGITRAKDMAINWKMVFNTFNTQIALYLIGLYILQTLIFMIPAIVGALGFMMFMAGGVLAFFGALVIIASIIGMLIIAIRLSLSMAFVLDTLTSPLAAIKQSIAATDGNFWNLVGIFLLQMLILIISVIPIGIGLIWSLPFSLICYGLIYKTLRANA